MTAKKASSKKAKKVTAPESSNEESDEVPAAKSKKDKKAKQKAALAGKKRKRTESMNSVKSNGSTGGGPITRRKSLDAAEAAAVAEPVVPVHSGKSAEYTFKRIDPTKFANKISTQFADNSFEAKARFGTQGGDSYGSWSNSKLADKKGASFIKEKNKMKNRQSHASGAFNAMAVNSIKF